MLINSQVREIPLCRSGLWVCRISFQPLADPNSLNNPCASRFSGTTHVWDNYVFCSGRGLIQHDWIGLADTVCVCVCDLSGASADDRGHWHCLFLAGQELSAWTNGWNKGLWNDPRLSSVYHNNTHTYKACVKSHKNSATWQNKHAVDVWAEFNGYFMNRSIFFSLPNTYYMYSF